MRARIINRSTQPISIYGRGPAVLVGESRVIAGLNIAEAGLIQELSTEGVSGANQITVAIEFGPEDFLAYQARMANPADPGAGVKLLAGVGFDLFVILDGQGSNGAGTAAAVAVVTKLGLGVFDDADCKTPSATAFLHTATTGAIVSGSGTNRLEVNSSAAGAFRCTVELPTAASKVVYLKAFGLPSTGHVVDCAAKDTVTFTP